MLRTKPIVLAWVAVAASFGAAEATSWAPLTLPERVALSDTVVLARVVDPARALVSVERVFKGEPARQITLMAYIDNFAAHKTLVANTRELLFLNKGATAYLPLQTQLGRWSVDGDRLQDPTRAEPRSLSQTLAAIEHLVALQARAARGNTEADAAFVAALRSADSDVQMWALWDARRRIEVPSAALVDSFLARWPKGPDPVDGAWTAAVLVANTVVTWRIQRAAPMFARIVTTSANGEERAWAAMALGGTGDRTYLTLLRRVATEDIHTQARALAYRGITYMLGRDALADLRLAGKDKHERVRGEAVADAFSLLEREYPQPRWPASSALVAEVRAFLTAMQRDPARGVRNSARFLSATIARRSQAKTAKN